MEETEKEKGETRKCFEALDKWIETRDKEKKQAEERGREWFYKNKQFTLRELAIRAGAYG